MSKDSSVHGMQEIPLYQDDTQDCPILQGEEGILLTQDTDDLDSCVMSQPQSSTEPMSQIDGQTEQN